MTTEEDEDGFVRVVARADTNLVLGLQAVGAGVSELSSAFLSPWRWARASKISPAPSTPTRPEAKACRRLH